MKTLKGKLSISRPHYSDGTKVIHINLSDENSGCEVVEVRISLEDFAEVLVGSFMKSCESEYNDSGVVGKIREIKDEIIPRAKSRDAKDIVKVLKPFEVDGWKGYVSDVTNPHKWVGTEKVRVSFHRYVDAPKKDENNS